MLRSPNVSVVFKLWAILVLLATVAVILAAVVDDSARRRTAHRIRDQVEEFMVRIRAA